MIALFRAIRRRMAKASNISDVLSSGYWAMRDVLYLPKNMSKPPFSQSIEANYLLAWQEFRELDDEIRRGHLEPREDQGGVRGRYGVPRCNGFGM